MKKRNASQPRMQAVATLPTLLRRARLSQKELAGRLQVDPSYISHIVLGRKQPSLRRATRIARELGVTLDEFQRAVARGSREIRPDNEPQETRT